MIVCELHGQPEGVTMDCTACYVCRLQVSHKALLDACNKAADFIDEHANLFPNGAVAGALWRELSLAIDKTNGT